MGMAWADAKACVQVPALRSCDVATLAEPAVSISDTAAERKACRAFEGNPEPAAFHRVARPSFSVAQHPSNPAQAYVMRGPMLNP